VAPKVGFGDAGRMPGRGAMWTNFRCTPMFATAGTLTWILLLATTACLDAGSKNCGSIVCPLDKVCLPGGGCASPEQVAACNGFLDGASCTFSNGQGSCQNGACVPWICGNGVREGGEACDGADLGSASCKSLGFYDDTNALACNSLCRFDISKCTGFCGDGIVNGPELCDAASPPNQSCVDYGFDYGRLGCVACAPSFAGCALGDWRPILSSPKNLTKVWASGPNDVFAIVNPALGSFLPQSIAHFDGSAWSTTPPVANAVYYSLSGSGPNDVWLNGAAGLQHYDGSTWSIVTAAPACNTLFTGPVWASGPNDVFALCETGGSHYDGTSWTPLPDFSSLTGTLSRAYLSAWGTGANNLFVVGTTGGLVTPSSFVAHYDGTSWTRSCVEPIDMLSAGFNVWGRGPNDVFTLQAHFDGASCSTIGGDTSLWGVGPRDLFASGITGSLQRYDGAQWGPMSWPNTGRIIDMSGDAVGDVFAVGDDGVYVWTGVGIESQGVATTVVGGVSGIGPHDVYAAASDRVLHFDGSTWSTAHKYTDAGQLFSSYFPPAIWSNAATNVFAVGVDPAGSQNAIPFHFDGTTWITGGAIAFSFPSSVAISGSGANSAFLAYGYQDSGSGTLIGGVAHLDSSLNVLDDASFSTFIPAGLTGVYATSPTQAFVVGHYASIYGGPSGGYIGYWDTSTGFVDIAMPAAALYAIWGSGPTDIFAVGDAGTILHYDGTIWTPMVSRTSRALYAVAGTGPTDVFAAGDAGTIVHFDGVNWMPVRSKDLSTIRGVWSSLGATFFVGDQGSIQRFVHTCTNTEVHCGDSWDNDCDGLVNCADLDCAGDAFCTAGGLCQPATDIACNTTTNGSNLLRAARIDNYACSRRPESGREVVYRLAPGTTSVTVTLSGMTADLDLIVVGGTASGGCDPHGACVGASATTSPTEQVSFTAAAGGSYYVVIDGYQDATSDFAVQVDCQ
jgi:hypothetical protein